MARLALGAIRPTIQYHQGMLANPVGLSGEYNNSVGSKFAAQATIAIEVSAPNVIARDTGLSEMLKNVSPRVISATHAMVPDAP